MNYKNLYTNFIESRSKHRQIAGLERHHVSPRSLGGPDCSENIVLLTTREHYFAHLLLVKAFPEHPNLVFGVTAFWFDNNPSPYRKSWRLNNRMPRWVRRLANKTKHANFRNAKKRQM